MAARFRNLMAAFLLAGLAACSSPDTDFQAAEQQDTEAAYAEFLARHPQGPLAEQAKARLDGLAEQRDWTAAEAAGTSAGYRGYLEAHPMGPNADAALNRLLDLERRNLWSAAQQGGTREAFENYLLLYPDSAEAAEARERLAALAPTPAARPEAPKPPLPAAASKVPPPRSVTLGVAKTATGTTAKAPAATAKATPGDGGFQVQLGAFSTRARAETQGRAVNARYAKLLGGSTRVVDPAPAGRDQLFRLVSGPLSEADARQACKALKASGQDCLVARRKAPPGTGR